MGGRAIAIAALLLAGCDALDPAMGLRDRARLDLRCSTLASRLIADRTVEVSGCGRAAVYVHWYRYRYRYSEAPIWLLDSPIYTRAAQGRSNAAGRVDDGPFRACGEGSQCPDGQGCHVERGSGECRPLCHGSNGDVLICPQPAPASSLF